MKKKMFVCYCIILVLVALSIFLCVHFSPKNTIQRIYHIELPSSAEIQKYTYRPGIGYSYMAAKVSVSKTDYASLHAEAAKEYKIYSPEDRASTDEKTFPAEIPLNTAGNKDNVQWWDLETERIDGILYIVKGSSKWYSKGCAYSIIYMVESEDHILLYFHWID